MRRTGLYSNSRQGAKPGAAAQVALDALALTAALAPRKQRWRVSPSSPKVLWSVIGVMALLLALTMSMVLRSGQRQLTQEDIDSAVLKTLETTTLPSQATKAAEAVAGSVVRVVSYVNKGKLREAKEAKEREEAHAKAKAAGKPTAKVTAKSTAKPAPKFAMPSKPARPDAKPGKATAATAKAAEDDDKEEVEHGVGTGVVIVDKGVILTNLHVVSGADRIKVIFADGLESNAHITGTQPENDLAVLQAHKIPDDLHAATMRSTNDLASGDGVVAVGFPFGIGPSTSAGVVSGLKRVFRSPDGGHDIKNLIQFDAAANPGNSGGPLVTMDGEVVGIVTAILNPTSARTFLGIGFAVPIENAASAVGLHPF